MRKEQKHRERAVIEILRKVDPHLPPGAIEDSESPDLLIRTAERIVGIDVREFYRADPRDRGGASFLRMHSQLVGQINRRATAEYERCSEVPLWVTARWRPGVSLRRERVADLASALASTVEQHVPMASPGTVELDPDAWEKSALDGDLMSLRIRRRPWLMSNGWGVTQAGFVEI